MPQAIVVIVNVRQEIQQKGHKLQGDNIWCSHFSRQKRYARRGLAPGACSDQTSCQSCFQVCCVYCSEHGARWQPFLHNRGSYMLNHVLLPAKYTPGCPWKMVCPVGKTSLCPKLLHLQWLRAASPGQDPNSEGSALLPMGYCWLNLPGDSTCLGSWWCGGLPRRVLCLCVTAFPLQPCFPGLKAGVSSAAPPCLGMVLDGGAWLLAGSSWLTSTWWCDPTCGCNWRG